MLPQWVLSKNGWCIKDYFHGVARDVAAKKPLGLKTGTLKEGCTCVRGHFDVVPMADSRRNVVSRDVLLRVLAAWAATRQEVEVWTRVGVAKGSRAVARRHVRWRSVARGTVAHHSDKRWRTRSCWNSTKTGHFEQLLSIQNYATWASSEQIKFIFIASDRQKLYVRTYRLYVI
jgi:hypothetical protein